MSIWQCSVDSTQSKLVYQTIGVSRDVPSRPYIYPDQVNVVLGILTWYLHVRAEDWA